MACVVVILALFGGAVTVSAQPSPPPQSAPAFEVASVKPNTSGEDFIGIGSPPGRFYLINMPLRQILYYAFDVAPTPDLLRGIPSWADNARFDVNATLPADAPRTAVFAMLRRLLEERFNLKARIEPRERDVYVLTRAAETLGPDLQTSVVDCSPINGQRPTPPGGRPACGIRTGGSNGTSFVNAGGATLDRLAHILSGQSGRPVLNRTGLSGTFDIELEFALDSIRPPRVIDPALAPQSSAPSVFTAVREQLGLRLDATRASVDHFVVEHIERPTPD